MIFRLEHVIWLAVATITVAVADSFCFRVHRINKRTKDMHLCTSDSLRQLLPTTNSQILCDLLRGTKILISHPVLTTSKTHVSPVQRPEQHQLHW